jgi:hypothetical protein
LLRIIGSEGGREEATSHLEQLLASARVEAEVKVLSGEDPIEMIKGASAASAVTFLGFLPPSEEGALAWGEATRGLVEGLGTVVLVWSNGDVRLEA